MGLLSSPDFDPAQPADADSVKFGAGWIRDIKARLQTFGATLFNLDTGDFRDNVIRSASLTASGVTPGTYSRVQVNAKGLVVDGSNPTERQTARLYRAKFSADGTYYYETPTAVVVNGTGVVDSVSLGNFAYVSAPFDGTLTPGTGATYASFVFSPPAGVTRVKATVIGGGGGAWGDSATIAGSTVWYGGAGGGAVETIIWDLDGTGTEVLKVCVGTAGATALSGGSPGHNGCPSQVYLTASMYATAGHGDSATGSAGGSPHSGSESVSLGVLRSKGLPGASHLAGLSGSGFVQFGQGADVNQSGAGLVVLEWLQ
ncbi:MAG: hypothetical protein WCH79_20680 [Planctomycetia bacterium]